MKKIGLAMVALMMSATLAFGAPVTLRWAYWGSEARIKRSQAAIDLFTASNPGIAVNPEVSGGTGDHFTKVDTQIAGGSGPDIIQMGGNINDYVK
jgi:multiple sugar transport system substrate-binding protein